MNTKRVFSALLALGLVVALLIGLCAPLYAAAAGTDDTTAATEENEEATTGEETTEEGEEEPEVQPDKENPTKFQGGDPECNEGKHEADSECDEICNICGAVRVGSGGHIYRKKCSTECKQCGKIRVAPQEHTYDPNKYCGATCTECKEVDTSETTKHSFPAWTQEAKLHKSECATCGQKVTVAHDFDNACDPDCATCGYTREPKHYYDNPCDDTCNVGACANKREVPPHDYLSMSSPAEHWKECRMCQDEIDRAPHQWGENWVNLEVNYSVTEAYHWHVCTVDWCAKKDSDDEAGHYSDAARHVYDDDQDTTCNVCGYDGRNVTSIGKLLGEMAIGLGIGAVIVAGIWLVCVKLKKEKVEQK